MRHLTVYTGFPQLKSRLPYLPGRQFDPILKDMKKTVYFNNYFLIAMPTLEDNGFRQSVIYLCEHNEYGAIGIVVNQPISMVLGEIFQQMGISCDNIDINQLPVLAGGPIDQERGFVFHKPDNKRWRSSIQVGNEIVITTSKDILEAIAAGEGPEQFVLSLGYAGWGPGQLEAEIKENAWLMVKADEHILFDTPFEDRWLKSIALLGFDPSHLSGASGHA